MQWSDDVSGEFDRLAPRNRRPSEVVAQLSPLRRTGGPLNHAVYDLIKERLLEGDYAAGTRLPTDDLRPSSA